MVVRDLMSSSTVIDFARSSEVTISKAQAVSLPFRNDNLTQLRPSVETFVDSVDGGVVIERERGSTAKKRPSATATDVESPKTSAAVANLLRNDSQKNSADVEHKVLVSPRIGQVEMVHLEEDDAKKKRCGHCCVVQ
uniref:Uncharacterized protein n=1 Tax=Romanomermis culicivorax TaxID=13658 RepID=A0A915HMG6_ROMCU